MLWQKCNKFIGSPRLQALLAVQTAAVHAMLALLKVTDKIKLMKYIPEVEMPRMQLYNSCFNEDIDIKSKPGLSSIAQSVLSTTSKKSSGTTSRTTLCRHSFLSVLCLSFCHFSYRESLIFPQRYWMSCITLAIRKSMIS